MKRKCPECNEKTVKVSLLTFKNSMHCENCFYQFKYTFVSKAILSFFGSFIPLLVVIFGIVTKSIILSVLLLVTVVFFGELLFAKYCSLKPVGLRAAKAKLREYM